MYESEIIFCGNEQHITKLWLDEFGEYFCLECYREMLKCWNELTTPTYEDVKLLKRYKFNPLMETEIVGMTQQILAQRAGYTK